MIYIPKLGTNGTYELKYDTGKKYKISTYLSHIDNVNNKEIIEEYFKKNNFRWPELYKIGEWMLDKRIVYENSLYKYPYEDFHPGNTILINGIWGGYIFQVNSRMEIDNLIDVKDSLKTSKKTLWAAIGTLIASLFLLIYDAHYKPKKEQKKLINKLGWELERIEKNQKDLENLLLNTKEFPSWNIHELNAGFYAERIDLIRKGKDTIQLKNLLFNLSRTIWNINDKINYCKQITISSINYPTKGNHLIQLKNDINSMNITLKKELKEAQKELNETK